jgi:hypothetical protein
MKRRIWLAVGLAIAVGWVASARADVLCVKKTKKGVLKGGLIARASCKKKEQQVDVSLASQLGIRGDQGPGLAVVDKSGKEVGIPVGSYYGTATVAFEVSSGGTSDWFTAGVTGDGFARADSDLQFSQQFLYDDASCTHTKFLFVSTQLDTNGNPKPPPTELSHSLVVDPAGTTGYFVRASEVVKKQVYRSSISNGGTAQLAQQFCTSTGGTVVGTPGACPVGFGSPGSFCVGCCRTFVEGTVAPTHTVDLSGITGPLQLTR